MANFDEFDAESQALLNNLQQNNKFLSFEDLNKGFPDSETFNSSNLKYFDNTSNQRSSSSPLGKNSLFNVNEREIISNSISSREVKKIWKYRIILDVNATRLIKEFREDNLELKNSEGPLDDKIDFLIYAEQNNGSISLGRVLLIKISDAMIKEYIKHETPDDLSEIWAKKIFEQQKNNLLFKYTEDEIHEAFVNSIKLQTKQIGDISILDIENFIKKTSASISTFFHEDIKFTREQWDPTLKSDKYIFDTPQKLIENIISKCDSLIKELKRLKEKLLIIKSFSAFGLEFNTPYIEGLIETIDNQINSIKEFKFWLIESKNDIQIEIPYLCGIWNGLIEFLAGIVDVILLAVSIVINDVLEDSINLDLLEIREGVEEILEKLIEAIVKDPSIIINNIIESIENYKYSRYDHKSLNKYQIEYHKGEDIVLAVDIIITIVTIIKGIAKLAKLLPKFSKWVDDILKRGGNGARKFENVLIKLQKVVYGESDLSKLAIKFRKTLGKAKRHNGNIAIVEYLDDSGKFKIKEFTTLTESEWRLLGYERKPHAERIMVDWILDNIPKNKVTRIYSELEPCNFTKHKCKDLLEKHFPDAIKEYSYDYPGKLGDDLKSVRDNSISERSKDMNKLVK